MHVVVVGNGFFGASIAKHLALLPKITRVTIIGALNNQLLSSHNDSGRVYCLRSKSDAWRRLTRRAGSSMLSDARRGECLSELGCIIACQSETDEFLRSNGDEWTQFDARANANEWGVDCTLAARHRCLLEKPPTAGSIDPYRYIKVLNESNKISLVNAVVKEVLIDDRKATGVRFDGEEEEVRLRADHVVVAAGALTNELLTPIGLQKPLIIKSEVVIYAKLDADNLDRMSSMPSLLYNVDRMSEEGFEGVYAIGPRYGRLKLGANLRSDILFDRMDALKHWYANGVVKEEFNLLKHVFFQVFPRLRPLEFGVGRCVLTRTENGLPIIDNSLLPKLTVAVGGNGYGAMTAAGVGELVANQVGALS